MELMDSSQYSRRFILYNEITLHNALSHRYLCNHKRAVNKCSKFNKFNHDIVQKAYKIEKKNNEEYIIEYLSQVHHFGNCNILNMFKEFNNAW